MTAADPGAALAAADALRPPDAATRRATVDARRRSAASRGARTPRPPWRRRDGALGFVFWPESPRSSIRTARAAIVAALPPFVDAGRRVRQPAGRRTSTRSLRLARLGAVQLHGDETPAYAGGARRGRCIKAVGRSASRRGDRASTWPARRRLLLLDAHDPRRRGGTGPDRRLGARRAARRRAGGRDRCSPAG